jgi:hypothetical protein
MASPAEVVRSILIKEKVGIWPGISQLPDQGKWQVYVAEMNDDVERALCVIDTAGLVFGREMQHGKILEHPGVKVMARSLKFTDNGIIYKAAAALDGIINGYSVCVCGEWNANIHSVYRTSNILYLGEESGTRRQLWSFNARVAFSDPAFTPLEE